MEFQAIIQSNDVYKPDQISEVITAAFTGAEIARTANTKLKYYNVPCAFDIETTSFYAKDEKRACMYLHIHYA